MVLRTQRTRLALSATLLALALPLTTVVAQNQAPTTGGTIAGVAVDSLRGGYLKGAVVTLTGTDRLTVTDSIGRFRLDSVAAGSHTLRFAHAITDSLGISLVTRPFEIENGGAVSIVLAIPSPRTITGLKCSAEQRKLGAAALIGFVMDADTEMPSNGAEVVVAWMDLDVGTKSIVSKPERRTGRVKADGSFVVCGIPSDLTTGALAWRGRDSTAALQANFGNGLSILGFHLPPVVTSAATPAVARHTASLRGVVTDDSGKPIKGARVAVEEDESTSITSDDGAYSLTGLRPGTRRVTARKIGFEFVEVAIDLTSAQPRDLPLNLKKYVPVLETVRISAMRTLGLERVGFAERKKHGSGRYLTPEQLDRWNSPSLVDALRLMPSLRFTRTSSGEETVTGRLGSCVRYFVDGHGWSDFDDGPNRYLSGSELGAIEVYTPLTAPPQFMSMDRQGQMCTSIVVWTKWKLRI